MTCSFVDPRLLNDLPFFRNRSTTHQTCVRHDSFFASQQFNRMTPHETSSCLVPSSSFIVGQCDE